MATETLPPPDRGPDPEVERRFLLSDLRDVFMNDLGRRDAPFAVRLALDSMIATAGGTNTDAGYDVYVSFMGARDALFTVDIYNSDYSGPFNTYRYFCDPAEDAALAQPLNEEDAEVDKYVRWLLRGTQWSKAMAENAPNTRSNGILAREQEVTPEEIFRDNPKLDNVRKFYSDWGRPNRAKPKPDAPPSPSPGDREQSS